MRTLPVKAESPIEDVVKIQCANLGHLNAGATNTVYAQAILAATILDITSYFGLSWSKQQVTECAETWFVEYPFMSMAEIKHFVSQCKAGVFTKDDFRHLSPFLLLGWLDNYMVEIVHRRREYAADQEAVKRHQENVKRMTDPSYLSFDLSKALEAIGRPVPKSDEEQAAEDLDLQKRRDEMVKAYAEQFGVDLGKITNHETPEP